MTIAEMVESAPKVAAAKAAYLQAMESVIGSSRWGEARRFAGRSAGLRLDRVEKTKARWFREYEREEARVVAYIAPAQKKVRSL